MLFRSLYYGAFNIYETRAYRVPHQTSIPLDFSFELYCIRFLSHFDIVIADIAMRYYHHISQSGRRKIAQTHGNTEVQSAIKRVDTMQIEVEA